MFRKSLQNSFSEQARRAIKVHVLPGLLQRSREEIAACVVSVPQKAAESHQVTLGL